MRLSEQLKVIKTTDRIRIIQGKHGNREEQFDPNVQILYCGYMGLLEYAENKTEFLAQDPEVVRMTANMEIRHKQYAERGLLPPYEPGLTRMYELKDLAVFLYYDIYIQLQKGGGHETRTDGGNADRDL